MRVERLGDGDPEIAVVAGIHGDEPCGVRAVERLLADPPVVERPVTVVIANEAAIEQKVRYVESDLNRSFPGDADGGDHESQLAASLTDELSGCTTLSLHSTCSHAEPFAVVDGIDEVARSILPALSVEAVVDAAEFVEGRLFTSRGVVEVECGLQGSEDAAENASQLVEEFLSATGAIDSSAPDAVDSSASGAIDSSATGAADGAVERRAHPVFQLSRRLPKPDGEEYEVLVENFSRVEAGEPYATADGEPLTAEEPFSPVLLSADGYEELFGYAAERVDSVS